MRHKADGHGHGEGHGYGDGYDGGGGGGEGYGYGTVDGYGGGSYGDDFDRVGDIAGYLVRVNQKFRLVRVGCQIHTLEYWVDNWESIVRKEDDIEVGPEEVEGLIVEVKRCFDDA